MVNLQLLATAASLAAVIVLVKPLLTFGRPCFGGDVLAVVIAGWFFHGAKSKGAEAPCPCQALPKRAKPRRTMPRPAVAFRGLPADILAHFRHSNRLILSLVLARVGFANLSAIEQNQLTDTFVAIQTHRKRVWIDKTHREIA